jgi:peptidoglycan/LPS O-acetylase OafA/YrhL
MGQSPADNTRGIVLPDSAAKPGYDPALDGLRGLAIGLVLLHHCYGPVFSFFWIGVDLFFVLSGFLITRILLDSVNEKKYLVNFYGRRVLRIFPLYYACLALLFLVAPLMFRMTVHELRYLFDHQGWYWTYMQNWLIVRDGYAPGRSMLLSHFWSLAIEEQYYLVWPFLVFIFRGRKLLWVTLVLIAAAMAVRMSGHYHNPGYYVSTFTRVDSLLIGALLVLLLRYYKEKVSRYLAVLLSVSGLLLLGGLAWFRNPDYSNPFYVKAGYTLLALFFAGLVTWCLDERMNWFKKAMNLRPLIFLGKYSYGLYVFHFPVYWLCRNAFLLQISRFIHQDSLAKIGAASLCVLFTIGLSLVSFHLLEKPFLRLKRYF